MGSARTRVALEPRLPSERHLHHAFHQVNYRFLRLRRKHETGAKHLLFGLNLHTLEDFLYRFRPLWFEAGRYVFELVDGLLDRLRRETDAARRRAYADALMRVYKKPAAWTYWGFRPARNLIRRMRLTASLIRLIGT